MKNEITAHYVDAAATVVGLSIPAECRAGVITNFQRIAALAANVTDFALPTEIEPAPVFRHAKR